jgi:hypothetical protein
LSRWRFFAGGLDVADEMGITTESDSEREEWAVL